MQRAAHTVHTMNACMLACLHTYCAMNRWYAAYDQVMYSMYRERSGTTSSACLIIERVVSCGGSCKPFSPSIHWALQNILDKSCFERWPCICRSAVKDYARLRDDWPMICRNTGDATQASIYNMLHNLTAGITWRSAHQSATLLVAAGAFPSQ